MGIRGGMAAKASCAAALALLSLALPIGVSASSAAGTAPSWEPDADAAPPEGNVVFYDANGNEITSGTNLSQPWAYAAGTTVAETGATKATLNFAIPDTNGPSPSVWSEEPGTASTTFTPVPAGTPADLAALDPTGGPYYPVNNASAANLAAYIGEIIPPTGQYADITQVRLTESGALGKGTQPAGTYWETDVAYNTGSSAITVDGTKVPADGWAELFPLVVTPTVTLTATPASPRAAGTKVTLKAKVSAGDAGQVQFFSGTTALGSAVTVSSAAASYVFTPAVGTYSFTAEFVPTLGDLKGANTASATIVAEKTSAAVPYTVDQKPTIAKVAPASIAAGKATLETITGTGFQTGVTVSVPSTSITVTVKTVSATKITATFTVPSGTKAGTYSVMVANPDGGAVTKASALTITG